MAATLDEIKEWRPAVLAGGGLAECLCPDADDSAGGKFLADVRDNVIEGIDNGTFDPERDDRDDHNGEIHEIADGAPDIMIHALWSEFVDLGAYQEESELGEWPDNLNKVAGVALYQIAERLVYGLLREWREGLAEAADEAAEEMTAA